MKKRVIVAGSLYYDYKAIVKAVEDKGFLIKIIIFIFSTSPDLRGKSVTLIRAIGLRYDTAD